MADNGLTGTGEEWRAMDEGSHSWDSPESDAAVRRARAEIPRIRMRDVELRVVDRSGRPMAGVPFELVQSRHAFPFGDPIWALDEM